MFKKRNLFLFHRWLGIVMCWFFLLWFVSGVVMLYTRMPLLFPSERFAGLPALDLSVVRTTPEKAWAVLERDGTPNKIRLVTVHGRPAYFFLTKGTKWAGVYADTGAPVPPTTVDRGAEEARRFVGRAELPKHVRTFDGIDQWTFSNSLNLHRPLHRYRFADAEETEVYVSQVTGEVVLKSTRPERIGATFGAYVHWLAPEFFRRESTLWRNALLYLSLAGTVLTLSGLLIGFLRYRREGYPNRTGWTGKLPYRGAMAWHTWTGLIFGGVTLTWIFSGWLYMNPGGRKTGPLSTVTTVTPFNEGGIRADLSPKPEQTLALTGGPLTPSLFTVSLPEAWVTVPPSDVALVPKEVEFIRFTGKPYFVFHCNENQSRIASAGSSIYAAQEHFSEDELSSALKNAIKDGELVRSRWLTRYDAYYYAVGAVAPKRLPILRLEYNDPSGTWFYVNPFNGSIFRRYDHHGRLMRWLVNGLHCLDFPILIENRPAWDIAVIGLSLGGFVLSATAVYSGGRRLRQELRGKKERTQLLR